MAPVKRNTTTTHRVTRGMKAAAVPETRTKLTENHDDTVDSSTHDSISTATSTRRATRAVKKPVASTIQLPAAIAPDVAEMSKTIKTKATRATSNTTTPTPSLTVAPRRRLKITPLAAPGQIPNESESINDKPVMSTTVSETKPTHHKSKKIGIKKEQSKNASEIDAMTTTTTKPRGRPKKEKTTTQVDSKSTEVTIPNAMTRSTRSQDASAVLDAEMPTAKPDVTKKSDGIRKKVTFQDLSNENDKENQPLRRPKSGGVAAKLDPNAITSKAMQARPLRSSRRTANHIQEGGVRKRAAKATAKDTNKKIEAQVRALTPKKIKQVTRSSSPVNDEISENEDELNGGKTPIRDLSISPRRPQTTALAKALSPAKKLDAVPSLVPKSPNRTTIFHDTVFDKIDVLNSPARRPAASPFRDSLKDSPRRGLKDGGRLLFSTQNSSSTHTAQSLSVSNTVAQSMSTMLQSPKRSGAIDPNFFSQSAIKPSASKSPFKGSLFGTPAKRLFSPVKQPFVSAVSINTQSESVDESEAQIDSEPEELSASSHFRSSTSPLRVVRAELIEADFDFDDSVLQVRSPLKVQKSPTRVSSSPKRDKSENSEISNAYLSTAQKVDSLELPASNKFTSTDAEKEFPFEATEDRVPNNEIQSPADHAQSSLGSPQNPQPISDVQFRSIPGTADEESSEDELAADQTPDQFQKRHHSAVLSTDPRSQLSSSCRKHAFNSGFGFTPLAAQISGWQASSPEKSVALDNNFNDSTELLGFSPLARQHIEGEVLIDRDSTPLRKSKKAFLVKPTMSSSRATDKRKSSNLRKSLVQRQSLGDISSTETPARNSQFEEYMEIRVMEEQADASNASRLISEGIDDRIHDDFTDIEHEAPAATTDDDTILALDEADSQSTVSRIPSDLTTDLIKFTHASDTAMVDFKTLAAEADCLAEHDDRIIDEADMCETSQNNGSSTAGSQSFEEQDIATTEQALFTTEPIAETGDTIAEIIELQSNPESPQLNPVRSCLNSPSVLVMNPDEASPVTISSPKHLQVKLCDPEFAVSTPIPNLKVNERRVINTVVSKVPLKPEGFVSPIKLPRKRSRSFGNLDESVRKRISLKHLRQPESDEDITHNQTPSGFTRTSNILENNVESTPAASGSQRTQSNRFSLGGVSVATTPEQSSFVVDDFGDSTLDGIEIPDDFREGSEASLGNETPRLSLPIQQHDSLVTSPATVLLQTPSTVKKTSRCATTPRASKRKPVDIGHQVLENSTNIGNVERTPLEPISRGTLHGAIVFVDVHTSEGDDASSIFIELLTQMGAKCVREWRWNSRASFALDSENVVGEQKIGITHVVFKDGGKRTLEKVRDAKGEVTCVGVAWVLDCERENRWLDESNYLIDSTILPRGGSKRRKSMQPRALIIGHDGSVSASQARRSVSAEMSELMKRELPTTPARLHAPPVSFDEDNLNEQENDIEQGTPTGFISYDPRTAMTPVTPYLVGHGNKLTQMSAPPKQQNKSLFDHDDIENEDTFMEGENGNAGVVKDARKFRMKNLGDMTKRRRTLGFKPAIGSPLGRV